MLADVLLHAVTRLSWATQRRCWTPVDMIRPPPLPPSRRGSVEQTCHLNSNLLGGKKLLVLWKCVPGSGSRFILDSGVMVHARPTPNGTIVALRFFLNDVDVHVA